MKPSTCKNTTYHYSTPGSKQGVSQTIRAYVFSSLHSSVAEPYFPHSHRSRARTVLLSHYQLTLAHPHSPNRPLRYET